ncbi:DegT/DnrJ/EryC1/StrS family aminotransferase [Paracrocinitomix mangrovi]|uniref:DegT/DnrJ/EryC1/StrS family aminotransferase n=1 Tax=Paracrocinitomix mangrovi TaxID=2862509 RepID=UPI001C8EF2A2|nr:DegT/DnrJ/EryC1/StrS family aminotransferase [Paracrocinitomix mangrovi]UKN01239.1 DegT/DnrJ/EryC1/StrS family aminotransferase [Paracrocinitomix mangrovi]
MSKNKPIFVTQPDLPDLNEFVDKLSLIWNSKILTNNGPNHKEFEDALKKHLNVQNLSVYSNGTIALLAALKALNLKGNIITTPYSFVATSHAIMWNGLTPVFADVCAHNGNLNPEKVEELIDEETTAIMPVHVYGYPCDIDAYERLAEKYNLKIIYDAAHCFDIKRKDDNKSILLEGDLSVLSFHATKAFNSIEGGAIISRDAGLIDKVNLLKNFGFRNEVEIEGIGINGKMNELQAAFGVLQLSDVEENISKRKKVFEAYVELLRNVEGISVFTSIGDYCSNYSYLPILVNEEYRLNRDELYLYLKEHEIYARRYFYPLISDLEAYKEILTNRNNILPVATDLSEKILCLPIYSSLSIDEVKLICNLIK